MGRSRRGLCCQGFKGVEIVLRSAKDLERSAVGATDGVIGHVKDFYFDDETLIVRYQP